MDNATTTLLYATDLKPEAEHTCRYVLELVAQLSARLHVLHVLDPVLLSAVAATTDSTAHEDLANDAIRQMKERLSGFGPAAKCVASINSVPGITTEAVLVEADLVGADMIVVGSSDKGILRQLLEGSSTASLLRKSRLPVLVVPLPKAAAAVTRAQSSD